MSSCIKAVGNEVYAAEHPDEYTLKAKGYFIVRLEGLDTSTIREDCLYFLSNAVDNVSPSCVHYFRDVLTLFYQLPTMLCRGRWNEIISYFVGHLACKRSRDEIRCNVVEFNTKSELFVYMCWRLHYLYLEFLMEVNPKLTSNELLTYTSAEIDNILIESGMNPGVFTQSQKYGDYYRLSNKKLKSKPGICNVESENEYIRFMYC